MANLLPEKDQKKIASDFRSRLILAGSYLMLGSAFFAALALFPSYAILFATRPQEATRTARIQNKADEKDLARTQVLVNQISPILSASSSVSAAILAAVADKPKGVHLDHITYAGAKTQDIIISGAADNRDEINLYRNTLAKDSHFTRVSVPVGALVGAEGGRFTLTLGGNF